jgi:hypothetical protein
MRASSNSFFVYPLFFLTALTPLFFGSQRPFFWAFWAAFTLILFILDMRFIDKAKVRLPAFQMPYKVASVLYFIFLCAITIQLLPIYDSRILSEDGYVITSRYLTLAHGNSIHGFLRWITYGIIFFIVVQITFHNEARSRLISRFVMYCISAYAFYGILALYQFDDTILGLEKWAYQGFATGPFVNRNSFATFLGFGIIISMSLLLDKNTNSEDLNGAQSIVQFLNGRQSFSLVCLTICTIALFLTNSRMGIFSTLVAAVMVCAMRFSIKQNIVLFSSLIAASAIVLLSQAGESSFLDRLLFISIGFDRRMALYNDVISMISLRPLIGFGMGSFEFAYPLYHSEAVSSNKVWDLAHSTYLANWVEMGLIFGSIPVLIVLVITFKIAIMALHLGSSQALSCLGCVCLISLHSLLDFSMEIHAVAIYFVIILALGYANAAKIRN